jgi:hypothetical protein
MAEEIRVGYSEAALFAVVVFETSWAWAAVRVLLAEKEEGSSWRRARMKAKRDQGRGQAWPSRGYGR